MRQAQLTNEKFLAKAPSESVQKVRERIVKLQEELVPKVSPWVPRFEATKECITFWGTAPEILVTYPLNGKDTLLGSQGTGVDALKTAIGLVETLDKATAPVIEPETVYPNAANLQHNTEVLMDAIRPLPIFELRRPEPKKSGFVAFCLGDLEVYVPVLIAIVLGLLLALAVVHYISPR